MYSKTTQNLSQSFTREILSFSKQDDIISFAGGLPLEKFLKYDDFKNLFNKIIKTHKEKLFQYSSTQGLESLREKIPKLTNLKNFDAKNILITQGSSEALDIVCRAFLEQEECVNVQNPTYLSALKLFELYGAKIFNQKKSVKLDYIITKFQNPTNTSWSKKEYKKYQQQYKNSHTIVVEDNPYMLLDKTKKYDNITSYLPQNSITIGSFSKSVAPDFRLGYIAAKKEFIDKFTQIKSIINLQSSYLAQYAIDEWIENGGFLKHIDTISQAYHKKSLFFQKQAKLILNKKINYHSQTGGMFAWIEFKGVDTQLLFQKAKKQGVVFVPGRYFFINSNKKCNFARFNFTNTSKKDTIKGLHVIDEILNKI